MKNNILSNLYRHLVLVILLYSCDSNWLDIKPEQSLITPSTLEDYENILGNTQILNQATPGLGEVASDSYQLSYNDWMATITPARMAYLWTTENMYDTRVLEWELAYQRILYANIIIEGLSKIPRTDSNKSKWEAVSGAAHFHRAWTYYNLVEQFAQPYEEGREDIPGIPLRISTNITEHPKIPNSRVIFDLVIEDAQIAALQLPIRTANKIEPDKSSAYGLLAKVFLTIGRFDQAYSFADSCLNLSPTLMDFNKLDYDVKHKIPRDNEEILFTVSMLTYLPGGSVDRTLYDSYSNYDLRKAAYYMEENGKLIFTGSYLNSDFNLFGGIAADEIYLIRAECLARQGRGDEAFEDIKTLWLNRWESNSVLPEKPTSEEALLRLILDERKKELPFRNIRWKDIRRLRNTSYSISITRELNGDIHELHNVGFNYSFPIPPDEMIHY